MYKGKRMNSKSSAGMKRKLAVLVSLVLVMSMGFGATVAFLIDNTQDVQNVFTPAEVPPTIVEDWNNVLKKDVTIKNSGNTDAYIRAAVVATWQEVAEDEEGNEILTGNIASEVPQLGTDYSIEYNLTADGWFQASDGYYYWPNPVKSVEQDKDNCSTGILITEAKQLVPNDNYRLVIEILAQTVQSVPEQAVIDAWGFVPGA